MSTTNDHLRPGPRRAELSRRHRKRCRGQALLLCVVTTGVLAGLGAVLLSSARSSSDETQQVVRNTQCLSIAESALRAGVLDLTLGGSGSVGTAHTPRSFGGGRYWTVTTPGAEDTFTISAFGRYAGVERRVRAVVRRNQHIFNHALFAGNSSGDPSYALDFGGTGTEADQIVGDVYSGNDITVWGDASVSGTPRAFGTISGFEGGREGEEQPGFDFSGMNYPSIADVRVHEEFAAGSTRVFDDAGGTAGQLPESNPAHIFRLNPDDRWEIGTTEGDDYFLEDPYTPVRRDQGSTGEDPFEVTVNASGETGPIRRLYYIEGNLWVHNRPTFSFSMASADGSPVQVTFVVKGDIYFSDNIYLQDPELSAVAFIALKDPNRSSSGNIHFGDPQAGTLETMYAYMYAENDFHDNHLAADGSKTVSVFGTMSAGNHVAINRTYEDHHSQLNVTMDPRLANGEVTLPGIPQRSGVFSYEVLSWVQF